MPKIQEEQIILNCITRVPLKTVRDLLVSAFEGGSNYWYQIERCTYAPGITEADFKKGGKFQPGKRDYYHWSQLAPTVKGCAVHISAPGGKSRTLDLKSIERGLIVMIKDYPKHWADVLTEKDDSATGDVFLQCCLFGSCVFG